MVIFCDQYLLQLMPMRVLKTHMSSLNRTPKSGQWEKVPPMVELKSNIGGTFMAGKKGMKHYPS